jgi:hypothetical protein
MTAPTPEQMRALAVTHFPDAGRRERELMAALRTAADELDRLRKKMRDAPHHRNCDLIASRGPCICWKANAL